MILKIGDKVKSGDRLGLSIFQGEATVLSIEICHPGTKYGEPVEFIDMNLPSAANVILDLDNNHWARLDQVKKVN